MRIVLASAVVIVACMAALLFLNRGGDAAPVPVLPASAPPAVPPPPPSAAAQPVAAVAAPKAAPASESKSGLQAQFDQALAAHDTRIEAFLIEGYGIDSNHIAALADENNYRRFVERMRADASQQSLNDTVAFQQMLLSRSVAATSGAVAVSDVVCGATLCTAAASSADAEQLAGYFYNMAKDHDLPKPIYSPVYVPYRTPSGFGMRLVFSMDSAVNEGGSAPRE